MIYNQGITYTLPAKVYIYLIVTKMVIESEVVGLVNMSLECIIVLVNYLFS